jgi:hypothetical protein
MTWGLLPEAVVQLPATQVDDLLAWADYDASRHARWRKDAEWRAKAESKRAEVKQEGLRRAQGVGPKHVK